MDRVNRRFLVNSTLIAIPIALFMVSLTTGTSPDGPPSGTRLAVVDADLDPNPIQQVVGKQIETGRTRPGLFQVLAGTRPEGNTNHAHQNMRTSEPRGLLDALFSSGRSDNRSSSATSSTARSTSNSGAGTRAPSADPNRNADVDWSGIPYHQADKVVRQAASAPIRDPQQQAASTTTRIIRGGAASSVEAIPRVTNAPALARRPTTSLAVPTPPPERMARSNQPGRSEQSPSVIRSVDSLSASSSSRRSGRRDVDTFAAPQPTPSTTTAAAATTAPQDEVVDLVPRVSRRTIAAESPKPAPATASESVPSKEIIAKQQVPGAPDTQLPKAVAAIGKPSAPAASDVPLAAAAPQVAAKQISAPQMPTPQIMSEPESAAEIPTAGPIATLAPPTAKPAYSTPVDPTQSPVPAPTFSQQPYAASTPAMTIPSAPVSHRSGPPSAAFSGIPMLNDTADAYQQRPDAFSAIGSGIAKSEAGNDFRRSAAPPTYQTPPAYQTAQTPSDAFSDPYQNRSDTPSGNRSALVAPMEREPAPATAPATAAAMTKPSAAKPSTGVPMHPIDGYAVNPPTDVDQRLGSSADNFAAMDRDSRNRMRSAQSGQLSREGSGMVASELPGIRVVTYGPPEVMIRQLNEYEIRVENRGSINAEGLIVRAMIPDWAEVRGQNVTRGEVETQEEGATERLVWKIDELPAGASEQLFVRLMAARSGTYNVDVDWTLMPQKSVTQVRVQEPRLDLTIEGPEEVVYGQSQTYKVRVLNPGDGMAPNVVFTLSPNSATPQTQRIGDIPPGKEAQFDVELTAQDLGDLKIHGLAMGDLDLRAEAAKTIRVAAAQIEATLNGPELKYQNTDATYNLKVQNVGAATTNKVVATLQLPAGVQYLGGIEGASHKANLLKWEITTLAPDATLDYQFSCTMASAGEHLFAFDCKGSAAGQADVSLTTRVESIADLKLTINDPVAPAPIGTEVTYEIVVHNRGSREARDVKALAQFSHGIEPQRVEGHAGEVVTGQVLFEAIPRVGPGEEVRLRIIAIAERAGHHRFRTEVRSGDTVLVAEEATHYMSPQSDRISRRSTDSPSR